MSDELEIEQEDSGDEVAGKIKKIKEKLEVCQKEKTEYLIGWQRARADFINYKRRQEEQLTEWSGMFGEGLIRDILPVLDTLDAAEKHKSESAGGLKLTRDQLMKILQKYGLEEIKSVGEKFNHNLHEAVEQVITEGLENAVVEEAQKGYLLNGKVIRHAKVKVSK